MNKNCYLLFATSSHAIRAEKLLKREGVDARLVPVPRQLSSDCGLCVRTATADEAKVREIASNGGLKSESIHIL